MILLASLITSSLAAPCSLDANNATICTTRASCERLCPLYSMEKTCTSVPGCRWFVSYDMFGSSSEYCVSNSTNACNKAEADCTADPVCFWLTRLCKVGKTCGSTSDNVTCAAAETEAKCTSQDPACEMADVCSDPVFDRCTILENQGSCTATQGCFWIEANSTGANPLRGTGCSSCYNDPLSKENAYLPSVSHVGQVCVQEDGIPGTVTYSVVVAGSGCTGGTPSARDQPSYVVCGAATLSTSLVMLLASMFLA